MSETPNPKATPKASTETPKPPTKASLDKLASAIKAEHTSKLVVARALVDAWKNGPSVKGGHSKDYFVASIRPELQARGVDMDYETARDYVRVGAMFPKAVTVKGANGTEYSSDVDVPFSGLAVLAKASGIKSATDAMRVVRVVGDDPMTAITVKALRGELERQAANGSTSTARSGKAERKDLARIAELVDGIKVDPHLLAMDDVALDEYVAKLQAHVDAVKAHKATKSRRANRAKFLGIKPSMLDDKLRRIKATKADKADKPKADKPKPKAPKADKASGPKSVRGNRKSA